MRTILRRRVLTGLVVAQFFPQSPIIVTGGNPQNGKTDGDFVDAGGNLLATVSYPDGTRR
jgi:hypothetical protein